MGNRNCPYCGKHVDVSAEDVLHLTKYRIEKETKCPHCKNKIRYKTSTILIVDKPWKEYYDAC